MKLKQYKSDLYNFDVDKYVKPNTSSEIIYNCLPSHSFIKTIKENESKYIQREVMNDEIARMIYKR